MKTKRILQVIVVIFAAYLMISGAKMYENDNFEHETAVFEEKMQKSTPEIGVSNANLVKNHLPRRFEDIPEPEGINEDPIYEEPASPFERIPLELTSGEKELLLGVGMAEAEGEDTKGKALVMRVVLNRVIKSGSSIDAVIYKPKQFAVSRMGIVPTEDCYEALAIVIDGWDESQGALYFCSKGYPKYGEPIDMGGDEGNYGHHWFSR